MYITIVQNKKATLLFYIITSFKFIITIITIHHNYNYGTETFKLLISFIL